MISIDDLKDGYKVSYLKTVLVIYGIRIAEHEMDRRLVHLLEHYFCLEIPLLSLAWSTCSMLVAV